MVAKKRKDNSERARFAFAKKIYALICDDRHKEAISLIEKRRKSFPEIESHRFIPYYASIQERLGNIDTAIRLRRKAVLEGPDYIPHHVGLAAALMDAKRWAEADDVLKETIAISLARDNFYFLDSCRFRRTLCLKALGRSEERTQVVNELGEEKFLELSRFPWNRG